MMKTILVPTDFSNNANNATNYAIALAKQERARLILVNAYLIPYISSRFPAQFIEDEIKHAELSSIHHLRIRCRNISQAENIKCEYISSYGQAPKVILEVAKQRKPDLIVMGTQGASGLKAAFFGSNTAKVLTKSKCPVIAVPGLVHYKSIKNIIYTTDFHDSDILTLKTLLHLFKHYDIHINVVHIYDGDFVDTQKNKLEDFRKKLEKQVPYKNISYKLLVVQNILQQLSKLSRGKANDLLVMSTHRRNLLDRLTNTSLTKRISLQTKIPLLVMHHKEEPLVII